MHCNDFKFFQLFIKLESFSNSDCVTFTLRGVACGLCANVPLREWLSNTGKESGILGVEFFYFEWELEFIFKHQLSTISILPNVGYFICKNAEVGYNL